MRAAQYVRMSTEHQQYSIPNQIAAISEYAKAHRFEVVRTYSDAGRSGIDLAHRPGLRQLLDDVVSRSVDFTAVLVYDVSRWGRFQDADESAHYEFLCKQSGIRVHYCAEQFSNDDSALASLIKALKRSMAGEYSRELSVKVFAGQRRLVCEGYKMGGPPGYGLRRILLSVNGTPERELGPGERKYLSNQRVTLAPGPEHELEVVRRIFAMYLDEDMGLSEIVCDLNASRVPKGDGTLWAVQNIRKILIDPKYAGCSVFARSTKKLHSKSTVLPRDQWIVQPNSFDPIVTLATIERARKKLASKFRSDEELLEILRDYVWKNGPVSGRQMRPQNGLPSEQTFKAHFGSLWKAYELAGVSVSQACIWGHEAVRAGTLRLALGEEFRAALVACRLPLQFQRRVYRLQGLSPFMFGVARCIKARTGNFRWRVSDPEARLKLPWAVARLQPNNTAVQDWCLVEGLSQVARRYSFTDGDLEGSNSVHATAVELVAHLTKRLQSSS